MNKIKPLSAVVANQIAAGEVVQRPASVLKELLENALDAKASTIEVTACQGGLSYLKISDDGEGMSEADLPLSVVRHATSKIEQSCDLDNIASLGFRGEALASIASVTKLSIKSKPRGQDQAFECEVRGDAMSPFIKPCAPFEGTIVEIRDLFYNTPGRRKFLKSSKTEFHHLDQVFKQCALSHPHVAFSFTHNEKLIRAYNKAPNLKARCAQVIGQKFIDQAVELAFDHDGFKIEGWLGLDDALRKNNDHQFFFVNQRYVKDKIILHAIKSAYLEHGIDADAHPSFVLNLQCPYDQVDVNVHPTKHEVRFTQPSWVHDFLNQCAQAALGSTFTQPEQSVLALSVPVVSKPLPQLALSPPTSKPIHATPLEVGLDLEVYKPKQHQEVWWHHWFLVFGDTLRAVDAQKHASTLFKGMDWSKAPTRSVLKPIKVSPKQKALWEQRGLSFKQNLKGEWLIHLAPACFLDAWMQTWDTKDWIDSLPLELLKLPYLQAQLIQRMKKESPAWVQTMTLDEWITNMQPSLQLS